jgi:hypothetical protein
MASRKERVVGGLTEGVEGFLKVGAQVESQIC